jgi:hypothetical protein
MLAFKHARNSKEQLLSQVIANTKAFRHCVIVLKRASRDAASNRGRPRLLDPSKGTRIMQHVYEEGEGLKARNNPAQGASPDPYTQVG